RELVSSAVQSSELIRSIRQDEDRPMETIIGRYTSAAAYCEVERSLQQFIGTQAAGNAELALAQARAQWCIVQLLQRPDHPDPAAARPRIEPAMGRAFAKVAQASEIGHAQVEVADGPAVRLKPDVQVEAEAPVRLDLAGGWSD